MSRAERGAGPRAPLIWWLAGAGSVLLVGLLLRLVLPGEAYPAGATRELRGRLRSEAGRRLSANEPR
ncbi:MAG: hypothetical protein ACYDAG_15600 [Chloroflexota bacterium]